LDYFKTEPKWTVSDPKYGQVDVKNVLKLFLDNIPRNQNVIIIVDTEAKVNVEEFVRVRCSRPGLTAVDRECDVEIINTRDFPIFGFKPQINAVFGDVDGVQVTVTETVPHAPNPLPHEFVSVTSTAESNNKRICWDVDLESLAVKRYRVSLLRTH
jgi:hypothetical protein